MYTLLGQSNIVVHDDNEYEQVITIIKGAGLSDEDKEWFDQAKQIHRQPICGGPIDPASQVQ
jgi:hypothetical protein